MVSHPSICSPKPKFHHINASFIKSLTFLGLSSFYVCSNWSKLICIHQPSAFFTSDTGCQVVVPLEMSDFQPLGDLSDVHFPPVISSPICFLRYSILSPIPASPFPNPVTLSRLLGENGILEVQTLPTSLLLFSGLTYNLLIHSYPFSPIGREQKTLLSEDPSSGY